MFRPHWSKRLSLKLWLVPLALVTLTVCKSKSPKPDDPPPDAAGVPVAVNETILIEHGESSQPSYSSDGKRLLFVSARRPGHVQPQVYERDLNSGIERRITFQNGSTSHPRFHPKANLIVYSSSTDEEKEAPPLLNLGVPVPSKLPPPFTEQAEVYTHSLDALEIRRVTVHPGFDGDARFSNDGKYMMWTRIDRDRAQLISENSSGGGGRVLAGLGLNPTSYTVAPDGKASSWIDWDKSFGVSRLRLKRGQKIIDVAADMIVTKSDNEFSPDSKWLLWAQKDPQTNLNSIWAYDLENSCLEHFLFPSEGDRRHPVVSPDMKTLTYTLVSRGRSRIAQVPFVQRTGPCPVSP